MKSNFWQRHPWAADTFGIFIFIVCVTLGTILINTFIFQSFTVVGSSMDPTFADGDKVIISRLQSTWANLTNTKLFVISTCGSFLIFAIFYGIVYRITARSYYKIVS